MPFRSQTDPRAVFILALCVVSGAPLILGAVEPGSLEELLNPIVIRLWGIALVLGALVTLAGMSWRRSMMGVLLEQIGSVAVGGASLFYAAAILLEAGWSGLVAAGIVTGWGLSCLFRWYQLERLIRDTESEHPKP